MEMVLEEINAPHDEDFAEHLRMPRMHTFRGKEPNSYVHYYSKAGAKKRDDDSADKFSGIMEYHGYSRKRVKTPGVEEYHKKEEGREHHIRAHFDEDNRLKSIQHHEKFVNEGTMNESELKIKGGSPSNGSVKGNAPFGKKLRDIVPRKAKMASDDDHVNRHSDGDFQQTDGMDKMISVHNIVKWPQHIGDGIDDEPFTVATVSGKDGKKLAPDVGFKQAPEHIKKLKGVNEDKTESEKDAEWNDHQNKVHMRLHNHWLKNPVKWTPHLMKGPSGLLHSMVQHDDGSHGSGEDHLRTLKEGVEELDELHGKGQIDKLRRKTKKALNKSYDERESAINAHPDHDTDDRGGFKSYTHPEVKAAQKKVGYLARKSLQADNLKKVNTHRQGMRDSLEMAKYYRNKEND